MNPDFEVDTEDLRRTATSLAGVADRVTGAAGSAPAPVPVPRWATTGAADLAATAASRQLTVLGGDVEETARQVRAAVAAYHEADARAAARLRLTR